MKLKVTTEPYGQAKRTALILGIIVILTVLMALAWVVLEARPTPVHAGGLPCQPTPVIIKTATDWLRLDVHPAPFGGNCQLFAQHSNNPAVWLNLWTAVSRTSGEVVEFAIDAESAVSQNTQVVVWREQTNGQPAVTSLRVGHEKRPGCAWTSTPLRSANSAFEGPSIDIARRPYLITWLSDACEWLPGSGTICEMRYESCNWRDDNSWGLPFEWVGAPPRTCSGAFLPFVVRQ